MPVCDDNPVEIYWRYIWKDYSGYAVLHESLLFLAGWWQKGSAEFMVVRVVSVMAHW